MPIPYSADTSYYNFPTAKAEFRPSVAAQAQPIALPPVPPARTASPSYAGAPQDDPAPWRQRWQEYLQQQAAYRQQLAQMLHGLGPYANSLTQVQQQVDARRAQVMQYMLGAGGAFRGPGQ